MTQSSQAWTPSDAELAQALEEIGVGQAEISAYLEKLGARETGTARSCTKELTGSCYCNGEPTGELWVITCTDPEGNKYTIEHCKCR